MVNFLKRVFAKSKSKTPAASHSSNSTNLDKAAKSGVEFFTSKPAQLITASALDIGRRRENNEDALLSITSTLAVDSGNMAFGLYAVADGMGGHQSGELASESALRAFGDYVLKNFYLPRNGPKAQDTADSLFETMEAGFRAAHKEVKRAAPGGGCTLTAALILGNRLIIAHLGDSRAYALEVDKEISALTRDHTLVQLLEEQGQITSEEAAIHPQKSILYRALGQGEVVEPEIFTRDFPQPSYLLLCTDGLWGVVDEKRIQDIVGSTTDPHLACHYLVEAANAAGGPDNIAVILVRLAE